MVTITTAAPPDEYVAIARTMHKVMREVASITPRPQRQIVALLHAQNVALAFDNSNLVGWLVAIPYTAQVQELGMGYVAPEYRNQGILSRMIDTLIKNRSVSLAATYERRLADLLIHRWAFTESSLSECLRVSQGRFITVRLRSLATIKAVISHRSQSKPIYLIRNGQK